MTVTPLRWLADRLLLRAGFEPTPEGQQTGSFGRVKPRASRRLRRSLTGRGLTRLAGLLWPGRAQPRQKETDMSPSTVTVPTERQLRYLRVLAGKTATTFAYPATRGEASREINRLRKLQDEPRAPRLDAGDPDAEQLSYATAVHASEVTGFGSSATWRAGSRPSPRPVLGKLVLKDRTELARYTVSGGERVLYGRRTDGCVTVTDGPRSGAGRSYLVERDLEVEGLPAIQALIADYVQQARELDEIPMASGAVRQLFAQAGSGA
jgi:hypothetical protein